jgi:hypothetical protein
MKAKNVIPIRQTQPPPPAPPPEVWPIVVKLLHGSTVNRRGEEIHQLEFRQPFARDVKLRGNPIHISAEGEALIDEKKMSAMIAALSDLPAYSIDRLDPRDWNSCAYRLRAFFFPEPAAWD